LIKTGERGKLIDEWEIKEMHKADEKVVETRQNIMERQEHAQMSLGGDEQFSLVKSALKIRQTRIEGRIRMNHATEPNYNLVATEVVAIVLSRDQNAWNGNCISKHEGAPITMLGRSKRSLRIEKQNVEGTGAPEGFNNTQCEYTDCVAFSKAWEAKFSQYSTTD
jgi:hypothetical protein